ncbi:conserved Plasmodium protein, unknown function [Plasmodium gallinaceum]|uniref:Uncharacterized protein n=1 Tax=Plasmodium gallinaceum TaxID=5849 RepID=A0A1J1GL97_PLAGA|nr:conserved Plasmodium protein, unknown function [Plasmodium gallinaceum]CRG92973.1 conserved Plasmodium protein, unknown function [Plasmodium gallinaceum]
MKKNYIIRHFNKIAHVKYYNSTSKNVLNNGKNEYTGNLIKDNIDSKFINLVNKNKYNTYKNRVYNTSMYNNSHPSYMNNNENTNNNLLSHYNYKYDSSNYYQQKYNSNVSNESSDNTSYQYFNIFGSTAMCLIKPIFPDYIINKNKLTIYGKGGFQFMFMRKQNNSNKYDKNNKMNIFLKINSLSSVLSLDSIEKLTNAIVIKGNNNNYLTIDKHKEKKDHIVIKYKYQPSNAIDNNFNEINNNLNIDVNKNININELNEEKKNNFEELHVSSPFTEFLIFQKAANLLLPQLIGWSKPN